MTDQSLPAKDAPAEIERWNRGAFLPIWIGGIGSNTAVGGMQRFGGITSARAMNRRIPVVLGAFLLLAINIERAGAECVCQCVDGKMQPLCQSSIDLAPVCPAAVCPIAAPSIAPLKPATIPPIGTSQCREARVCDTFGNCQWREVCR
jgi:uncharacterized membrane protein YeaQ/YmgE (transglycosylase-associated protein family)